jgi:hypothetical protein
MLFDSDISNSRDNMWVWIHRDNAWHNHNSQDRKTVCQFLAHHNVIFRYLHGLSLFTRGLTPKALHAFCAESRRTEGASWPHCQMLSGVGLGMYNCDLLQVLQ